MTMARPGASRSASVNSPIRAKDKALRFSGRLSVISVIGPSFFTIRSLNVTVLQNRPAS